MTPLRRARVRVRMAVGHRPFWLEVFAGGSLAAWGAYVLLMPFPIGQLPFFAILRHVPHANGWVGGVTLAGGCGQAIVVLLNLARSRIAGAITGMLLWAIASRFSGGGPHPGIVLYASPIAANAYAMVRLIYDLKRRP